MSASFSLPVSQVGFSYEEINPRNHKWEPGRTQTPLKSGSNAVAERWCHTKRRELDNRDDVRNIKAYWSPEGSVQIPVDSFPEAVALAEARWTNAEPSILPPPLWVVIAGSPIDGFLTHGPFLLEEEADAWGSRIFGTYPWWTQRVGVPQ